MKSFIGKRIPRLNNQLTNKNGRPEGGRFLSRNLCCRNECTDEGENGEETSDDDEEDIPAAEPADGLIRRVDRAVVRIDRLLHLEHWQDREITHHPQDVREEGDLYDLIQPAREVAADQQSDVDRGERYGTILGDIALRGCLLVDDLEQVIDVEDDEPRAPERSDVT